MILFYACRLELELNMVFVDSLLCVLVLVVIEDMILAT